MPATTADATATDRVYWKTPSTTNPATNAASMGNANGSLDRTGRRVDDRRFRPREDLGMGGRFSGKSYCKLEYPPISAADQIADLVSPLRKI
jgi:hypothetical protein